MIDPRISLAAQAPNLETSFNLFQNTLNSMQNRRMNAQTMQQRDVMNPLTIQAAQDTNAINAQVIQQNNQAAQRLTADQNLQSIVAFSPTLKPFLQSGDNLGALRVLQTRKQQLASQGRDFSDTDEAINEITNGNPDSVLQSLNVAEIEAQQRGLTGIANQTAGQRQFNSMTEGFTPEERMQAQLVSAGLAPRAASSSTERIAQNQNLGSMVASQAQTTAAATETGKLTAQLKLKPEVEAAVARTLANVKAMALDKTTARSNEKAYATYQAGLEGLSDALADANTGVISGTMFALTDNNRIAKGAGAVMLPIMKAMFRGAGEGTFTDKDQEVLENMLPTTSDSPAVAKSKLRLMDVIIQSKIGPAPQAQQAAPQQPQIDMATLTDADIENLTDEQLNALLGQ